MSKSTRERRGFRRAVRRAARRAVREGTITRLQRGQVLLNMQSDDVADEMADVCLAAAVECRLVSVAEVDASAEINWVKVGEGIDWEKLVEFIMKILPMFL